MARPRNQPQWVMAREAFVDTANGDIIQVAYHELVHPDHPLVRAHPDMFEPAKPRPRFDVEQTTNAPGERRGEPVHQ